MFFANKRLIPAATLIISFLFGEAEGKNVTKNVTGLMSKNGDKKFFH